MTTNKDEGSRVRAIGTPKGYVPTRIASKIIGRSEFTTRDLARKGLLPCYRPFGPRGQLAFDPVELAAYVRSTRVGPQIDENAPGRANGAGA